MLKEQKWVLKKIQKEGISVANLIISVNKKFKKGFSIPQIEDIITFLTREGYLREERARDFFTRDYDLVVSPEWLTSEGHDFGKISWWKLINSCVAGGGVIVAIIALLK